MRCLVVVEDGTEVYGICADWAQAASPIFWYRGEELIHSTQQVANFGHDDFAALEHFLVEIARHHDTDEEWVDDMLSRPWFYLYVCGDVPYWNELKKDAEYIIKLGLFKNKKRNKFAMMEKALQLAIDLIELDINVRSLDLKELKKVVEEHELLTKHK